MLDSVLALLSPPHCLACAEPVQVGRRLCAVCTAELPWLRTSDGITWSACEFEGPARALVHALKFRHRTAAADVMAAQIAANAPAGWLADGTLTWAPAHRKGQRERGFDHAQLLASALSRRTHLPLLAVLTRDHATKRQVGAGRAQRQRVEVRAKRRVAGRLVVVDDVTTTGATLHACARALGDAGAADVKGVTYARALG